MSDIQKRASKIVTAAELDAAMGWGWFSMLIRANPKTGFFIGIVVGLGLGWGVFHVFGL